MESVFRAAAIALVAICLLPVVSHRSSALREFRSMSRTPRLVLWAWERQEDLRFLDSEDVGVAFLAGTISLRPHGMTFRPRMQTLRVSPQTRMVAVIRIETEPGAQLDHEHLLTAAAAVEHASKLPHVGATQIDFDATTSEHAFYRDLLLELRRRLPASMPLSITALASWCIGDNWMDSLPIDEAVPMLFRLGVGQNEIHSWMGSRRDFRQPACRGSVGISTDEPWRALPSGRRVYAFSPTPWTKTSYNALLWEMHAWR
jgi:Protein of unknown function (DUF3142)